MSTWKRNTNTSFNRRGHQRGGLGSSVPGMPWRRKSDAIPRPPSPVLGPLLATVGRPDLAIEPQAKPGNEKAHIEDCQLVASYNWLNSTVPTILVPGMPPAWAPLPEPVKLQEDQGQYFRDQNAARYSSHPMQPAVEAILAQTPDFQSKSIDIVGCGSTLGNLLRFARNVDLNAKYRIFVEVVGSTVFFLRRVNQPTETIPDVRGFGHTFPEAYTSWDWDVKGSESHQRLIKYKFAGLSCLVRFESDGYLPDLAPKGLTVAAKSKAGESDVGRDVIAALQSTTVSERSPVSKESLTVHKRGQVVPQAAVFDLKTRSIFRKGTDFLEQELPRLWISQTPNFVLAFHRSGLFEEIEILDTRARVNKWEEEQEDNLLRYASLLRMLTSFALGHPDGRFEIFHEAESAILELREVEDNVPRVLPGHLKDRWAMQDEESANLLDEEAEEASSERDIESNWGRFDDEWQSDSEGSSKDYTACSASDCGYCGRCRY
ncbi:uncharacterized protein ACLA_076170 [Aspergillus clavatus NRRL 1]|uniref:Geranylgeranyl pyrophosphate synthetase n=1 Tax=Aspergillus clavatus (strain ATCC 1007 / CBS 513.65 / DSM 816 / NCTC 3887 / NRRL 1 / QM 1276 / 107) TaxID=344612 RepID=A1C856_ASPCL|nr:uncharacterized protein ACLA_076170 [Aspergillus clavatus NRRL 1]EAW14577.1 hypothetical protein ACLA_076170 [Aspergillus clavatus NRRL 1]